MGRGSPGARIAGAEPVTRGRGLLQGGWAACGGGLEAELREERVRVSGAGCGGVLNGRGLAPGAWRRGGLSAPQLHGAVRQSQPRPWGLAPEFEGQVRLSRTRPGIWVLWLGLTPEDRKLLP